MKRDVSDCIAMSEDADWFAFPIEFTRGEVIGALAEDSDWFTVLREFHVKRGHVVQDGEGWYWEAEATDVDAIPAWIAKRR